jgi:membrane-bound metal-dependent hydrolase YbcI (DUF457 family)
MLLGLFALVSWIGAESLQRTLPPSLAFAVTDEIAHASVAVLCASAVAPAWGFRPVLVALLTGTAIDVDHAVAARSLDPMRMMSLGARPATHSLAGVVLIAVLIGAIWGPRSGYAALLGAATHVMRDANGTPGAPLFAPFSADAHVILPAWSLPVIMLAFGISSIVLAHGVSGQLRRRLRFSWARLLHFTG